MASAVKRSRTVPLSAEKVPRAKLEENCELREADNVQGQISEHIFKAKSGGYCGYYPSNIFRNM